MLSNSKIKIIIRHTLIKSFLKRNVSVKYLSQDNNNEKVRRIAFIKYELVYQLDYDCRAIMMCLLDRNQKQRFMQVTG